MAISGLSGGFGASAAYFGRQNLQGQTNNNVPSVAGSLPASSSLSSGDSELNQLEAFFKEPAAEQMQDLWLMKHGISKAQFDAMSPDQKQKILEQMKQDLEKQMKQKAQDQASKSVDILA